MAGHADGLNCRPRTGRRLAAVTEDAGSSLYVIDPAAGSVGRLGGPARSSTTPTTGTGCRTTAGRTHLLLRGATLISASSEACCRRLAGASLPL